MQRILSLTALLCSASLIAATEPVGGKLPPAATRPVDFGRDIRPILDAACVSCHGADKQRGGLRLDSGTAAARGGNAGPAYVPGDSQTSRLIHAVAGLDADLRMPPSKAKALSGEQIGLLRAWIDQGAKWPATTAAVIAPRRSTHWAFQPIRSPAPPAVNGATPVRNGIDRFVFARLEREKLAPSPQADPLTLLRRVSLDLTGLPPTPSEIDAFLADRSPGAYERMVDRLLASPHYGERWGRHWLDVARYADSDGYEKDSGRPHAWRYRHWVLDALNRDLPYDQFTIEQLAGDLLPGSTPEQKAATGFHRNTLTNREGGVDREQFRVEAVVDRVATTGRVWLGLTVGCTQCHDHKTDPLAQREFYQLFAFFNRDVEVDLPAPLAVNAFSPSPLPGKAARAGVPAVLAQTLASGPPRKTHVLIRGDFLRPGVEVTPDTPAVLPPLRSAGPATRLDLARWLVRDDNPLTARVAVNWVWQKLFGRGLVATPEDFGTQGERPTHPELLDWLADDFMRHGWSLKALQRRIVTSATYRQSSHVRPELLTRDPYNTLLARQVRQRLEAEVLRDTLLAASGLLVRTVGGPSVRPPQPAGISELTYAGSARWVVSSGADRYRRGLYTWFQRTSPYPMLLTFDAPDANLCCVRRERSNTPLQALTLLNDAVFVECARALAGRMRSEGGEDPADRLRLAFRRCTGREANRSELARLLALHAELAALCAADPTGARQLLGEPVAAGEALPEAAARVGVARVLLNLDEVVTRE